MRKDKIMRSVLNRKKFEKGDVLDGKNLQDLDAKITKLVEAFSTKSKRPYKTLSSTSTSDFDISLVVEYDGGDKFTISLPNGKEIVRKKITKTKNEE